MKTGQRKTPFAARIATPADEVGVSALLEASYSQLLARDYSPAVLSQALPLITVANPILLACGTFFVVETKDRQIIGCGGWTPERPSASDLKSTELGLGHIRHFATHPAWTRRGVGQLILSTCKDQAHQNAVTRLECYSTLSARKFYEQSGFRVCNAIDLALSGTCRFPSLRMECAL